MFVLVGCYHRKKVTRRQRPDLPRQLQLLRTFQEFSIQEEQQEKEWQVHEQHLKGCHEKIAGKLARRS